MSRQRAQRIGEEIKKEISDIIRQELKDPALEKMTSVTGVDLSRDLSHVKIFVSIFASDEEKDQAFKALEKAGGFIRSELSKRIRLRHTPELEFRLDRSMEYGAHIDGVLKTLDLAAREGEESEKQGNS